MQKGKLELLQAREANLKAEIAKQKILQQQRIEREKARLASIIGLALIEVSAQQESVGVMVRQILAASSLRESDRTFLAAKGWV